MDDTPDTPIDFGYKATWLAIRHDDSQSVASALPVQHWERCNWRSGRTAIYGDESDLIFVAPSIHGWVLAAGRGLPQYDGPEFEDRLTPLLGTLGASFPDVQHFGTHRIVGYHSWSRVVDNRLVRSFVYLGERGEVLCDHGEPDEHERLVRDTARVDWRPTKYSPTFEFYPDEEHVTMMAAAWSIDPTQLRENNLPPGCGWLGRMER